MNGLLETIDLTKRYGEVTVLRGVAFDVRTAEIHALLGANGAGKSTLCKIISGLVKKSSGAMTLLGKPYDPANKHDAERNGVEIVQQELNLIRTLSVAENLFFTRLPQFAGMIDMYQLHREAREILVRFGLGDVDTHAMVETLGTGRQQMVEIASALARDCKLLILDEPTAALSGSESERLFDHLKQLRSQGVGIVYISHRLDEVARLSDRVSVFRDGQCITTLDTSSVSTEDMVDLMSGQQNASSKLTHKSFATNQIAMKVDSLTCGPVHEVTFGLHRGERLGIAGLVGSGRTETLRAIFGADLASSGCISLGNYPIGDDPTPRRFRKPSEAVSAGLAMVTEDRKQNGLLLSQSIRVNMTLCSMWSRFSRRGLVRRLEEQQVAVTMRNMLEIRCEDLEQATETLSGGNQQKVAVAKWLVRDANVFLFDEPTRGIDVNARRRIYRLFESLAQNGKGIVIVSSDLEELMETCDRIGVMSAGRLVAILDRDEWSHEKIMQASFSNYSGSNHSDSNYSGLGRT